MQNWDLLVLELGGVAEGSQDQNSETEWEAHRGNNLEIPPTYL